MTRVAGTAADLLDDIVAATRRIVDVREAREPLTRAGRARGGARAAQRARFVGALSRRRRA